MESLSAAVLTLSCSLFAASCLQSQDHESSPAPGEAQSSNAGETTATGEPTGLSACAAGHGDNDAQEGCDGDHTLSVDSQALDGIQLASPAELQQCLNACKAGGSTILAYCGTMPTPQFRALCYAAAASGTVSCMGFCYARFVD